MMWLIDPFEIEIVAIAVAAMVTLVFFRGRFARCLAATALLCVALVIATFSWRATLFASVDLRTGHVDSSTDGLSLVANFARLAWLVTLCLTGFVVLALRTQRRRGIQPTNQAVAEQAPRP